ncbi:MAG: phosphatidylserine decarboxylase [Rhodanobacter denitrificans]|uniref:Phosphatidylserine decarboxylase proenzyme n=1 Tax=Rhodanobacter denitrificans TaxID=666685 RepID=A0A2W5MP82_9GAMM|nr:MAG: phosphatidylserine decarboxylase [Rhodanobacter denitrificans]
MNLPLLAQHLLPHRLLSRLVYWATRWEWTPWKNFLIGQITHRYQVDLDEAEQPDASAYPHFNAFFTRALKPGARRFDAEASALLCPADGRVSQVGAIADGRIFQAKGQSYTTDELLGDALSGVPYRDGRFATIYLAPRDYHRVHMPWTGTLRETVHVPGRLFSVAPFAVAGIPRLFARNERLVCHFDGEQGPFTVVLVGAMLVSSVSTVWGGLEIPPYASRPIRCDWRGRGIHLARGAELGRFNMGSTVIVLLPPGPAFEASLLPHAPVKVGQPIGRFD